MKNRSELTVTRQPAASGVSKVYGIFMYLLYSLVSVPTKYKPLTAAPAREGKARSTVGLGWHWQETC